MNCWIVKCRERLQGREGWHWNRYFDNENDWWDSIETWGGPDWIRSRQSRKYIREIVRKGDLVICYQAEGKAICGITQMADDGLDQPEGSGDYNLLSLIGCRSAFRIDHPITVAQLRETGCDPEWLRKGQGTVFPLSAVEFKGVIRAIKLLRPSTRKRLGAWLKRVGCATATRELLKASGTKATVNRNGAGFCTDPIQNAKVERVAIRTVIDWFESHGWRVKSRERDKCGFDLQCRKAGKRLDVEVKGVSGTQIAFPITPNEVAEAENNPRFRICVVTEATTERRKCHKWSGQRFLSEFKLKPAGYFASLP